MFKRLQKDAPELEANSLEHVYGFYRFYVGEHVKSGARIDFPLP